MTHKGIESQFRIFVVPGNGPVLLEIPDCKSLTLLSINCDTIEADHNRGQVNEQSKQGKSKQKSKP